MFIKGFFFVYFSNHPSVSVVIDIIGIDIGIDICIVIIFVG